jgi:hypothetical protein
MSTLNPVAATTRRVSVAPPALETVAIRWSLSRAALRASKTHAKFAPVVTAISEAGPDLELCWQLDLETDRAGALLRDPAGAEHALARGSLHHSLDGDLLHAEVDEGGETLLAATVRISGADARVLYARTSLLAALGLGGGRYEVM